MVKHTRHGLSLFISVRVTGYPRISSLNHGKNVEFEIVLREDYPFSPPEICCNTEVTSSLR